MDECINGLLDSEEPEGYFDSSTHHFPGHFSFKEPSLNEPSPPLQGDLMILAMVGDPVVDVKVG